jgi:hypothetical protein
MVCKYFVWLCTPCDSGIGCQKLRGTSTKCRSYEGPPQSAEVTRELHKVQKLRGTSTKCRSYEGPPQSAEVTRALHKVQKLRGPSTKCRSSQEGKMLTANHPKSHKSIMNNFVRSALFPKNSVDEIIVLLVVAACNLAHGWQYFRAASGWNNTICFDGVCWQRFPKRYMNPNCTTF